MEILCFFAGTAFFYLKSPYALGLLSILLFFRQRPIFLLWFAAAMIWCLIHQEFTSDQGMPALPVIRNALIRGEIVSVPAATPYRTQFQFQLNHLQHHAVHATILLNCYQHCPSFHTGETWEMTAKLKKPINLANPGGFDYVGWLSTRHIHWIATAKQNTFKQISTPQSSYRLLQLREHLANRQTILDPDEKTLGIFQALTLGFTHHVPKPQWDLFRRTGTTHLIDISGEHIALIAGITYWLIKWIWGSIPICCLRYPAPKIASIMALIMAFGYAFLSGFAVPTQRALITCFFLFFRNLSPQRFTIWQAWRYALLLVLLIEPHAILMLGFFFSFLAVAILILIHQRWPTHGLYQMLIMQCACLAGLMPLSLYWFSYGSLNGLIANLIAIPWVSFLIVPEALLITFLSPWIVIPWSMTFLTKAIDYLLICLQWVDAFSAINVNLSLTMALSSFAMMAALACLVLLPLPQFLPTAFMMLLASAFPGREQVKSQEAYIDVLDVGQGLAILIRTQNHQLMYDTGMQFYRGNDMGKLVIIPYLDKLGIHQLDKVIISHSDLDHRGGLSSLNKTYSIKELIVDDPAYYHRGTSCHHHADWHWDGIWFRFFSLSRASNSKNNHSCVLQISSQNEQVLLTGDIEAPAEHALVKTYGSSLHSTILLVPHHGSKTSSTLEFIERVSPRDAIISYGFDNRYHFPHAQTIRRYQQQHIALHDTYHDGMIRIHLQAHPHQPEGYRK